MKWMLEMKNEKLQLAAQLVLSGELTSDSELIPLRAIMLNLLYPTMKLEESIQTLIEEGVTGDDLIRALQLIAAYLRV